MQPDKTYSPKMKISEENIAIQLLKGKIKDFELNPNDDKSMTELLAYLSTFNKVEKSEILAFYDFLINNQYDLGIILKKLLSTNFIQIKEDFSYRATRLGRAVAKSFLTIDQGLEIIENLKKTKNKEILEIALELEPLKNVYLSKKMISDLSKNRAT